MSAAFGSIHEYQIDQPSLCLPASLSRSTNYKGHKANPIISVDRSLHIRRFLRGFIDLVFEHDGRWYIVDYKSNVLPGYTNTDLHEAMYRHHYVLQYHLYTLALERYLKHRIPEFSYQQHFGGVLFMFLRGLSDVPGEAIFTDKPDEALVTALASVLGGEDAR